MNRTNIVLAGVLVVLAVIYVATRDSNASKTNVKATKIFPDFNKEAVDYIIIEGGWEGTQWIFSRLGSQWTLASAGGYPVKAETVNDFIDAVSNLSQNDTAGSSAETAKKTRTDERGRLVKVMKGETPMAEFRIGKTPPDSGQEYFVRKEGDTTVYRTRTLLSKDIENMPEESGDSPWDTGPTGYRWSDYTRRISDWVEPTLWRLGNAQTQEVQITRTGVYEVTITRKGEEQWELKEAGKEEAFPADLDVAQGFAADLRYLNFDDVLGLYEEVNAQYGLDKPEITLILTLKQKIEKKKDEKKDPEKKDPEKKDEKDEKKKPEPEFKLVKRSVQIGKRIERPTSIDEKTGEIKKDSYYAVKVGGVFDDPEMEKRARYVFLVDATSVRGLRKELADLKQKVPEKKDEEKKPGDKKDGDAKKPDDKAKPDDKKKDDATKKPGGDSAAKKDDPAPKKDDDAGKEEPKKEEPKKDDGGKEEPKKDDGGKEEPKKDDDPKKDG